nr:hypothetical protein [Bradyrhizobium arachidis]
MAPLLARFMAADRSFRNTFRARHRPNSSEE